MKKVITTSLVVLAALGMGCASDPPAEPTRTVDEILAEASPAESYGKPERCLNLGEYDTVEVIDEQTLIFHGRRGKVWLNRLTTRCPGLRKRSTLKFDLHTTAACRLDTVASISDFFGWQQTSAECALGNFEPISEQQAEMLKAELQK